MALIPTAKSPNEVRPHGGRMLTEANGMLPIEDMVRNLTTDPMWKTATILTDGTNDVDVSTDGSMATEIYDGAIGPVGVDKSTNAIEVIQYDHHEIHGGSAFVVCEQNTLAQAGTRDYLFITPNTTRWSHLVYSIRSSGEANFLFYEGTTTSANGTALTAYNRNRNSDNTAGMLVYHTPTVSSVGTLLCTRHFGAGKSQQGEERGVTEWVLRQNTKYLLRITSEVAANDVSTSIDWYEHTDKTVQTHTESSSSSSSSST